jgi:hypothetical protein
MEVNYPFLSRGSSPQEAVCAVEPVSKTRRSVGVAAYRTRFYSPPGCSLVAIPLELRVTQSWWWRRGGRRGLPELRGGIFAVAVRVGNAFCRTSSATGQFKLRNGIQHDARFSFLPVWLSYHFTYAIDDFIFRHLFIFTLCHSGFLLCYFFSSSLNSILSSHVLCTHPFSFFVHYSFNFWNIFSCFLSHSLWGWNLKRSK